MKLLKLLLKSILVVAGLFILFLVFMLMGENYETVIKNQNNTIVRIEIKKVFGKKVSEATLDSSGYYHGGFVSWHLFSDGIWQEGHFENGYWHNKWKEYKKNGKIQMVREWDRGQLKRLFLPKEKTLYEVPKENWPKYANVQQKKARKARN